MQRDRPPIVFVRQKGQTFRLRARVFEGTDLLSSRPNASSQVPSPPTGERVRVRGRLCGQASPEPRWACKGAGATGSQRMSVWGPPHPSLSPNGGEGGRAQRTRAGMSASRRECAARCPCPDSSGPARHVEHLLDFCRRRRQRRTDKGGTDLLSGRQRQRDRQTKDRQTKGQTFCLRGPSVFAQRDRPSVFAQAPWTWNLTHGSFANTPSLHGVVYGNGRFVAVGEVASGSGP
jgi:hypothetical protein